MTKKELSFEEQQLDLAMLRVISSFKEIHYEFYKNIGMLDNPLKFKSLAEKHCWQLMSVVYQTIEHNKKASRNFSFSEEE